MSEQDFEKNLFITYLDETRAYTYPNADMLIMASLTCQKAKYINTLEKEWNKIRKKYNVPDGVYLHAAGIKALLNPKYLTFQDKKRDFDLEKIFFKNGQVDKDLIYNFYVDIMNVIYKCEFDIVITSYRIDKTKQFDKDLSKKYCNTNWYILFREHLDNLAYFTMKKYLDKKKCSVRFQTKLRYDGDQNLSSRDDIRDAFSHSITAGTKRFDAKLIRHVFDELRFINKSEVGNCTNCNTECDNRLISHAGSEIIDFIALYAGKYCNKEQMINDHVENFPNKTKEHAEKVYNNSVIIKIDDKKIEPLNFIKSKIFIS